MSLTEDQKKGLEEAGQLMADDILERRKQGTLTERIMNVGRCPFEGVANQAIPGHEPGRGCPVCRGLKGHIKVGPADVDHLLRYIARGLGPPEPPCSNNF